MHKRDAGLACDTPMLLVKKYANRRLYDTAASKYITLEELAEQVKKGTDVLVQDAHAGTDLTQATLTQIILESRGGARLLPVPLLLRLIRMDDEQVAEFFGRYVSWSLETYLQAKQGAASLLPLNPLATAPFAATDALARLVLGASNRMRRGGGRTAAAPPPPPAPEPAPFEEPPPDEEAPPPEGAMNEMISLMAKMRAELSELKSQVNGPKKKKAPAKKR